MKKREYNRIKGTLICWAVLFNFFFGERTLSTPSRQSLAAIRLYEGRIAIEKEKKIRDSGYVGGNIDGVWEIF